MAMPIKETPVLKGESARRFLELVEVTPAARKISVQETEARRVYVNAVLKKAKI